ncbi:2-oxoacid:acceptor oxidoreductase family protein [Nanoarchaeota archaeon]
MQDKITIAGFGGQGVVLLGNTLAYGALFEGKHTTNMVSYGAEMRGGTANSTTIISDNEILSPVVDKPSIAIIMNQPSLDKFEPKVEEKGVIFVNSTLIKSKVERSDLVVVEVPATEIANELGNVRIANMVMLGAFIAKTKLLSLETAKKALAKVLESKKDLIEINETAIERGMKHVC